MVVILNKKLYVYDQRTYDIEATACKGNFVGYVFTKFSAAICNGVHALSNVHDYFFG